MHYTFPTDGPVQLGDEFFFTSYDEGEWKPCRPDQSPLVEHYDTVRRPDAGYTQALDDITALRKHLRWAMQEIDHDRLRVTKKVADHECDFYHNPELGHCSFCDSYVAAWTAIDATHFDEED